MGGGRGLRLEFGHQCPDGWGDEWSCWAWRGLGSSVGVGTVLRAGVCGTYQGQRFASLPTTFLRFFQCRSPPVQGPCIALCSLVEGVQWSCAAVPALLSLSTAMHALAVQSRGAEGAHGCQSSLGCYWEWALQHPGQHQASLGWNTDIEIVRNEWGGNDIFWNWSFSFFFFYAPKLYCYFYENCHSLWHLSAIYFDWPAPPNKHM